ncbi:MAG: hydrogenase maturation protease, partial [Planctomycetota bacterium]
RGRGRARGRCALSDSILVAGVGDIFQGDDAFGVEVARALAQREGVRLRPDVRVVDFGTRGYDLALALLDAPALAILVDTVQRGEAPGTLYVIDPSVDALAAPADPHSMHPANVLALVAALGGTPPRVLIVGCEPLRFATDEEPCPGLSAPVAAAIPGAVELVEKVIGSHEARAHA